MNQSAPAALAHSAASSRDVEAEERSGICSHAPKWTLKSPQQKQSSQNHDKREPRRSSSDPQVRRTSTFIERRSPGALEQVAEVGVATSFYFIGEEAPANPSFLLFELIY